MKLQLQNRLGLPILITVFIMVGVGFAVWRITSTPKKVSFQVLSRLEDFVSNHKRPIPQELVVLPAVLADKSPSEREQWLRDVLRDEISKEGIQVLMKSARFGSLADLFPESAHTWARAAGAKPEDCYAFRMDRDGITAEVVLVPGPDGLRISRCNNVKQMAYP